MSVDFSKVTWSQEQVQRILEDESLAAESAWVGNRYTADAAGWRNYDWMLPDGTVKLPYVPAINQLNSKPPAGSDQNQYNNCGPACVSIVTRHVTDVWLYPDQITDAWYGPGYTGYTSTDKLSSYLVQRCGIDNTVYDPATLGGNARSVIEASLNNLRLVIGLIYFDRSKPASGHFVVYYGYNADSVLLVDPYGGLYKSWPWGEFATWHKGWLIVIDTVRKAPAVG
jgi:hypothetical protein